LNIKKIPVLEICKFVHVLLRISVERVETSMPCKERSSNLLLELKDQFLELFRIIFRLGLTRLTAKAEHIFFAYNICTLNCRTE
jgi:hypothetical protein